MAIFNSYVKLPEGISNPTICRHGILQWIDRTSPVKNFANHPEKNQVLLPHYPL